LRHQLDIAMSRQLLAYAARCAETSDSGYTLRVNGDPEEEYDTLDAARQAVKFHAHSDLHYNRITDMVIHTNDATGEIIDVYEYPTSIAAMRQGLDD
jgi:hypothetical protein